MTTTSKSIDVIPELARGESVSTLSSTFDAENAGKVCYISKMDFYNLVILNDYLLVDTRSTNDCSHFSIANSINIPPEMRQSIDSVKLPTVELPHTVLLYHGDSKFDYDHLLAVADYFANKPTVQSVYVLQERFEEFFNCYPFLCNSFNPDDVYPCQLLSHLFLGSSLSATNPDVINNVGITHILQADSSLTDKSTRIPPMSGLKICHVAYDTSNEKSVRDFFNYCTNVIEYAKQNKGRVLLFCHRGESKSPCVALVYLMRTLGWTYEDADDYVKRARPVIEMDSQLDEIVKQIELEIFSYDQ
jgi:hypothetical protein